MFLDQIKCYASNNICDWRLFLIFKKFSVAESSTSNSALFLFGGQQVFMNFVLQNLHKFLNLQILESFTIYEFNTV